MFKNIFKKKTAVGILANSNYPVNFDACGACSMRVAGMDDSRPEAYVKTLSAYGPPITGGEHIDPIDDDKTNCDICGEHVPHGEFFDVAARRLPRA